MKETSKCYFYNLLHRSLFPENFRVNLVKGRSNLFSEDFFFLKLLPKYFQIPNIGDLHKMSLQFQKSILYIKV